VKFKKEYFDKMKPISKGIAIDELVNHNGGEISGDYQPGLKQIQTGPIPKPYDDDSTYTKGRSTTSDEWAKQVQPRSWWSLYYGYAGTPYSRGYRTVAEATGKEVFEKIVDKTTNKEIVDKEINKDLMDKLKNIGDLIAKSNISQDKKDEILKIINDSN
jgi:ABC-type proline/glycine betaine transport system substrate-binding protein